MVIAGVRPGGGTGTSGPGAAGPGITSLAGVPSDLDTGTAPPPFYVTVAMVTRGGNGALGGNGAFTAEVRRTSDGAATATLPSLPAGWHLTPGVSAAGDRTFFVAAVTVIPCTAPTRTRFYRLALTDAGGIGSFGPVGSAVSGVVSEFSAAPDGSRVAFTGASCAARRGGTL